jgi:hypothetical protein
MSSGHSTNTILRADPEHGGVRLGVLLTIIFGLVGFFILVRLLLSWFAQGTLIYEFATAISCVVAIPAALALGWFIENYLKRTWSSGLEFELAADELRFSGSLNNDGERDRRSVRFDKRINLTQWYFDLDGYHKAGRERRVSRKWLCLATQIQQDGERIIVFTYTPPDQAQAWIDEQQFPEGYHRISLANLYSEVGRRRWNAASRPEISSEWLAGPDGRYWIAERRRWEEGLELTPGDYAALMDYLAGHRQPDTDQQ